MPVNLLKFFHLYFLQITNFTKATNFINFISTFYDCTIPINLSLLYVSLTDLDIFFKIFNGRLFWENKSPHNANIGNK